MDDIELVPLGEAMKTLGVGRSKFYELLPSLEGVKIGSKTLVTKASLRDFVAGLPRIASSKKREAGCVADGLQNSEPGAAGGSNSGPGWLFTAKRSTPRK